MKNKPFWWLPDDSEWEIVEYDNFMKQTIGGPKIEQYQTYNFNFKIYLQKDFLMDIPCWDIHINMALFWNLLYEVDAQTIAGK